MSRIMRFSVVLAVMMATTSFTTASRAGDKPVSFGPHDVHSVFYVAKSENQNQVHYGLRLDSACRPVGRAPVFAYWRRHRSNGRVDAPLVGLGQRFYGASDDQKVERQDTGGHVQMHVKALDKVIIDIAIQRTNSGCVATPTTRINGERAQLSYAFLQLGRHGLSVKYVDVHGKRPSDGSEVVQRIEG